MEIEGAGVLVAGGASGLGAATAVRLRAQGAAVTIADINTELGEALAAEHDLQFVECDVRMEAAVQTAVSRAAAHADRGLRVAVSCAGIGFPHKVTSRRHGPHPLSDFKRVIELNLVGTFNVLRLATTAMLDNEPEDDAERGVVVNTASVAAFEGQIGQIAYSASKGAIVSMTITAARDLAGDGIRVLTIAPGVFDTPLLGRLTHEQREGLAANVPFPKRLGQPVEYAQLVQALVENPMLNGTTIRLDGALRMPPR
jgi:3-hydroxyacyl-CoA dehydrogenase / 3-hydroxy-2-methylbutyryl-CoA dehydrogenase